MEKSDLNLEVCRRIQYTLMNEEDIFPEIEAVSELHEDGTVIVSLFTKKKGELYDMPLELIPILCDSLQKLYHDTLILKK